MSKSNAQRKTLTQQRAHVENKHPQIELVPDVDDTAQEAHPKPSAKICAASAQFQGQRTVCTLELMHAGPHQAGARSWRRRSGDTA